MNFEISKNASQIPEALSIYMNQLVYLYRRKGIDITTLSLGEAFFDLPFYGFENINVTKGYHYSESLGLPELRKKITDYYFETYNSKIDSNSEIMITAGSKIAIYMALQAVVNEGDEVLLVEPAWLTYPEQVKLVNGIPKCIPYYEEPSGYSKYMNEKTKALIINNPNNPAGKVYTREELSDLYQECKSRGIYLIIDEAYSDFVDEGEFISLANIAKEKEGIVIVNSLSKNLGISGWRIGYIIANSKLIETLHKLNQHLITCAPTILQLYLVENFDKLINVSKPQIKEILNKRKTILAYFKEKGIEILDGSSTFYFFVNAGNYSYTSLDLAMYLLFKYHISVVPGSAYGDSTDGFIRIGIGVESVDNIKKAIDIIYKVIENDEFDKQFVDNELVALGVNEFN